MTDVCKKWLLIGSMILATCRTINWAALGTLYNKETNSGCQHFGTFKSAFWRASVLLYISATSTNVIGHKLYVPSIYMISQVQSLTVSGCD